VIFDRVKFQEVLAKGFRRRIEAMNERRINFMKKMNWKSSYVVLITTFFIFTLSASLLGLCLTPVFAAEKPIIIKYAHGDPPDPIKGSAHGDAVTFKHLVEAASGGRIKVEVYPACQLGSEREMLEGVKMGTIEVTNVSEGPVAGFFQEILLLGTPYLFESAPLAWKVLDGPFGRDLMEEMRKKTGIRCLTITENGSRNFTNRIRPIKKPEDLKGMKIRTMENPAHMEMVRALGADPTPIAWGELYTALQQKVVDGQENPVSLILVSKFYEVQKYLTLDGHLYSIDFTFINDPFFQKLPKDLQRIVGDAARISGTTHRGIQQYTSAIGVDELKQKGMEIYVPTPAEIEAFAKATQPRVVEWVKQKVPQKWIDYLFREIKKARAELYGKN
jgi:tripartite ATP-independent transporter DctP family solute receptor